MDHGAAQDQTHQCRHLIIAGTALGIYGTTDRETDNTRQQRFIPIESQIQRGVPWPIRFEVLFLCQGDLELVEGVFLVFPGSLLAFQFGEDGIKHFLLKRFALVLFLFQGDLELVPELVLQVF